MREISATQPLLFQAMNLSCLDRDQQEALCQVLGLLPANVRITPTVVTRGVQDSTDLAAEEDVFDREKWGMAEMTIARVVGGDRRRRDQVRNLFRLAVRIIRLASVN